MKLLKPLTQKIDGVEVHNCSFILNDNFEQLQNKAFEQFKPARNAVNQIPRGLRWGIYINDNILWTDNEEYCLPVELNEQEKGNVRLFDLIPEEFLNTDEVQSLIRQVFEVNHGDVSESFNRAYVVQLSALRYQPTLSETVMPSPPCPHQDGFNNASFVLRKSPGIVGGVSRIYTLDDQPLYEIDLKPGQGLFVEDANLKHQVLPMMLDSNYLDSEEPIVRDILIIRIDEAKR